jgi:hypothetical protein
MGVAISEGKVRSRESQDSIEDVCFSRGVFTSSFIFPNLLRKNLLLPLAWLLTLKRMWQNKFYVL